MRQACDDAIVDYREVEPPNNLKGLVKAWWSLEAGGRPEEWIINSATPDGCVEVIHRVTGRSRWGGEQPHLFVVGLSEAPVDFEISGDSRFQALRLWPWTWRAISGQNPAELVGQWSAVGSDLAVRLDLLVSSKGQQSQDVVLELGRSHDRLRRVGLAVIEAASVAEMRMRSGLTPRSLQRWFESNVGLPPQRYLRLLRFQNAFEEIGEASGLADHAADHGFADQSHMAREFRRLAGSSASRVLGSAVGPFVGGARSRN